MICDSRRQLKPPPAGSWAEAGFTILEATIAMVILSLGIIAVTNLFVVAAASNSVGNATTTAAALASERMDALKAAPFNTLAAGGDLDGDPTTNPTYSDVRSLQGAAQVLTEWQIVSTGGNTFFIRVRSQPQGGLTGARARAEFTTFRTCGLAAVGQACAVAADCCSGNCGGSVCVP